MKSKFLYQDVDVVSLADKGTNGVFEVKSRVKTLQVRGIWSQ